MNRLKMTKQTCQDRINGIDHIGICVGFLCHDGDGRFLFAKRSANCRDEHGTWDCGGGALDFGNKVEEQLRQEIKEEYCADVIESEFIGYRDVFRTIDGRKSHWLAIEFLVRLDPGQVMNGEPHKFDKIGWFRLDDLPKPLHSQIPGLIKKHIDKLKKVSSGSYYDKSQ